MEKLSNKIKKVKQSIIAVGFKPNPNKVTIIGSGFCVQKKGVIMSAAHLYKQVPNEYKSKICGMAMTKQEPNGLEHYKWSMLELKNKDDVNDVALFEYKDPEDTLLAPLSLGDSDKIEAGEDAYFIGFPYAAQLINEGMGITLVVNKTIVSNIKRDGTDPSLKRNFIILDAISNPGNSGSPLIDLKTNKVVGVMVISWRVMSKTIPNLDIREPMHICAAKPINLASSLL